MTLTHCFHCKSCGCSTPGRAEIPDNENPRRQLTLEHECHSCDAPLEETKTLSEWAAIAKSAIRP